MHYSCDPKQRYRCEDCPGLCCKSGFSVLVSIEEKERITALPALEKLLQEKNASFQPAPVKEGFYFLPRTGEGSDASCLFLDSDDLCLIHKHAGLAAKPATCKAYPFQLIERNADERVVTASFQCKSVITNKGDLISRTDWSAFRDAPVIQLPASLPVLRRGDAEAGREEYLRRYDSFCRNAWESRSFSASLLASCRELSADFTPLRFQESVPLLYSFFWHIGVFSNPRSVPFSDAWFHDFNTTLELAKLPPEERQRRARQPQMWHDLGQFHTEISDKMEKEEHQLLKRYLMQLTQRSLFLAKTPSLLTSLLCLAYSYEFLLLHAKIVSVVNLEKEISKPALLQAIHTVEGHFAFHNLGGATLFPPETEKAFLNLFLRP